MEEAIKNAIERQAKKLIERQKREHFAAIKYQRRFRLRTGKTLPPAQQIDPKIWSVSPRFHPVYCLRHSKFLAHTIWRKIIARTYKVEPAVLVKVPKEKGGYREIMVFSIPDAAVANLFNRKLRDRNKNLQSPFCYSYRVDKSIFDAVLQTASLLRGDKIYVIQYDFAKYFDSIKHEYVRFVLNGSDFFVSPTEKYIIDKFLTHRFATHKDYKSGIFEDRKVGVPQGCSLSLFLSNIAAHELDKELEKSNGMFVRFADDMVCVTREYGDAARMAAAFKDHCHYSGIEINFEKSPGICLMKAAVPGGARDFFIDHEDIGRITTIGEFDYIGHKFTAKDIQISDRGIGRIKKRIGRIIHVHLLHNLKRGLFAPERIGAEFYDWDLVTCINELRNYIYGGLRQQKLISFIAENKRIQRFKGLMSFYPLVTSVEQFAELDGWLVSVLRRAMKERSKLIKRNFGLTLSPLSDARIVDGAWYKYQSGLPLETGAPSFVLAWRAARKAFRQYGLRDFEVPKYYAALFDQY